MSRENAKSGRRCPNCGGRMRLVNVTLVDRFQAPEASQYDLSVSRRKASRKKASPLTTQEMMCASCAQRSPLWGDTKKPAKVKKVKGNKVKNENKSRKTKKKRVGRFIKFLIFFAMIAVAAYFAYQYRNVLIGYWEPLAGVFKKVEELIAYIKGIFNK